MAVLARAAGLKICFLYAFGRLNKKKYHYLKLKILICEYLKNEYKYDQNNQPTNNNLAPIPKANFVENESRSSTLFSCDSKESESLP